jgi:hypothetical protein
VVPGKSDNGAELEAKAQVSRRWSWTAVAYGTGLQSFDETWWLHKERATYAAHGEHYAIRLLSLAIQMRASRH